MADSKQYVTPAAATFLQNLFRLESFVGLIPDEDPSARATAARSPLAPILRPSQPEYRDAEGSAAAFAFQWFAVMLVTITETYLQDVLAFAAEVDPTLMAKSGQTAEYSEILAAHSIGELVEELRARWARGFLDDGGPTRWIDRLTRMGARFPDGIAGHMEPLWGIRHVVVHRAGVVTKDFERRHPHFGLHSGQELILPRGFWVDTTYAVADFQSGCEEYFHARYQREVQEWVNSSTAEDIASSDTV
jgi:hypothetical protein